MQFQVTEWVILLFRSAKKWDIGSVKLKATTPQGIFFEASCPALMFNRADKRPFTLLECLDLLRSAARPVDREELARLHAIPSPTDDLGLSALEKGSRWPRGICRSTSPMRLRATCLRRLKAQQRYKRIRSAVKPMFRTTATIWCRRRA